MQRRLSSTLALGATLALLGGCVEDYEPLRLGEPCVEEGYLGGPFGTETCSQVRNICFEPANDEARAVAGEDGRLSLGDLFADESVLGILLFGTAGWCQYCSQEAIWLNSLYAELQDLDGAGGRIEVVAAIFEDDFGATATSEYAQAYAAHKGLLFPAVADTFNEVLGFFDASAAPGNIFINRSDMTIQQVLQGFDLQALERALGALDGSTTCQ